MKHEGNWTCQLKVNSFWNNATNFVVVKDVTPVKDVIENYVEKIVSSILDSIENIAQLINEFD